jgi:3-dehydroquinate synthase
MQRVPEIIEVEHALGSYPVVIQTGLIDAIGEWLAPYLEGRRTPVIVSDEQVWSALGEQLSGALLASGISMTPVLVPAGEPSKSWTCLTDVVERLLDLGVERGDTLVAFGGGVVGDLTGFAASILKRGCNYIQVPTSLLAQVDSSVGGKTGINAKAGKNLVGAFHQPSAVLIDPTTLDSLPERHIRAGYAEIVKYGLIGSLDFFSWCESAALDLIGGDVDARSQAILASVRAKSAIVARDERESSGERALLNFGHTFAHALEAQCGLDGGLLHGEAVAAGMILAMRLSAERGLCSRGVAERTRAHLAACGLPTEMNEIGIRATGSELVRHMRHDKKAVGSRPKLILSRGIGQAFVDDSLSLDEIASFLDSELRRTAHRHAALR